ncbi:MAG: hypothetical protein N4A40_00490 [Tissierellales bacterium]|jgi:hypothetical protein|nr:hypothetical protein [Tissierellales bacterium]
MEKYSFFDSTVEDERAYSADEFAEYFRQVLSTGILNGGNNLQVICSGTNMILQIKEGYAWMEGYLYKIESEPLNIQVDTADPTLDRIDRVVVRLDKRLEHRYIKAFVLKGVPGQNPSVKSLTRDENIFEISLAQIRVIAGKSFIEQSQISDERLNKSVCGLASSLISADTTDIFNQFQSWYNTKTANYDSDWKNWWINNPIEFKKAWDTWFSEQRTNGFVLAIEKGRLNGIPTLDQNGNVPLSQLGNAQKPEDYARYESDYGFFGADYTGCTIENDIASLDEVKIYSELKSTKTTEITCQSQEANSQSGVGQKFDSEFTKNITHIKWIEFKIDQVTGSPESLSFSVYDKTAMKRLPGIIIPDVEKRFIRADLNLDIDRGHEIEIRLNLSNFGSSVNATSAIKLATCGFGGVRNSSLVKTTNAWTTETESSWDDLVFRMGVVEASKSGEVQKNIDPKLVSKWGNLKYEVKDLESNNAVITKILSNTDVVIKSETAKLGTNMINLSDIDPKSHKELKIKYEISRSTLEDKTPRIIDSSITWKGLSVDNDIYKLIAKVTLEQTTARIDFENLDLEKYKYIRIIVSAQSADKTFDRDLYIKYSQILSNYKYVNYFINSSSSSFAFANSAGSDKFLIKGAIPKDTMSYCVIDIANIKSPYESNLEVLTNWKCVCKKNATIINGGGSCTVSEISKISMAPSQGYFETGSSFIILGVL